jgi:hypothetical protein
VGIDRIWVGWVKTTYANKAGFSPHFPYLLNLLYI